MQNSGTKLVIALVTLAFLLGLVSWCFRYEAAHRASQFWGPEASPLIAESDGLEVIAHDTEGNETRTDLSRARGQAHLRHAFLSDHNFVWDEPVDAKAIRWKWHLRFYHEDGHHGEGHEGEQEGRVLLSDDLKAIGKQQAAGTIVGFSCEPMTGSLVAYFEAVGLVAKPQAAEGASIGVTSTAAE